MTVAESNQSILTKGHVVVGGWDNIAVLRDVDLFPLPSCSINSVSCKIPDLPQPRLDHSLSLLPDGWLVVCGGRDFNYEDSRFYTLNTCYSWTVGKESWTHFYTMRFTPSIVCENNHHSYREARSLHTAWTPLSSPNSLVLLGGGFHPTAEILLSSHSSKPSLILMYFFFGVVVIVMILLR